MKRIMAVMIMIMSVMMTVPALASNTWVSADKRKIHSYNIAKGKCAHVWINDSSNINVCYKGKIEPNVAVFSDGPNGAAINMEIELSRFINFNGLKYQISEIDKDHIDMFYTQMIYQTAAEREAEAAAKEKKMSHERELRPFTISIRSKCKSEERFVRNSPRSNKGHFKTLWEVCLIPNDPASGELEFLDKNKKHYKFAYSAGMVVRIGDKKFRISSNKYTRDGTTIKMQMVE